MFGWLFKNNKKDEVEEVRNEVKNSFSNVKDDIEKVGQWVTHFHGKHSSHENEILGIKDDLSTVKNDIEEIKNLLSMFGQGASKQLFKTNREVFNKQTAVQGVQTAVQTAVQTGKFSGISNLSVTEKAIVWILANNELKLSYDDLAAMLGKTKSTVRGQVNSIRQKSEGLIEEYIEKGGKKRVYMPEEVKDKMLKKMKVSVKKQKNKEKE